VLKLRLLSALVMIPVAVAAAWYGSWAFLALVTVAGIALAWEWSHLCYGRFTPGGRILAAGAALLPLTGWLEPKRGLAVIALTMLLCCLPQAPVRSRWWMALGALYILLPQLALIAVREQGRGLLLWLLFLVWATDSGAYFAGRLIGGPKLAPRISPKKTWSGLAGGVIAAGLVGWSMQVVAGPAAALRLVMASMLLSLLSQAGDLAESGLKRYFDVKDSSQLIPGHGGVFDRLDGLLVTAPAVAALALLWPGGWDQIYGW
jgi:phosphatidate cytidylyltransferase